MTAVWGRGLQTVSSLSKGDVISRAAGRVITLKEEPDGSNGQSFYLVSKARGEYFRMSAPTPTAFAMLANAAAPDGLVPNCVLVWDARNKVLRLKAKNDVKPGTALVCSYSRSFENTIKRKQLEDKANREVDFGRAWKLCVCGKSFRRNQWRSHVRCEERQR